MRKPKIRDSVFVTRRGDDTIFFFTTTRRSKRYRLSASARTLVTLLDGARSLEEILTLMRAEEGYAGDRNVLDAISFLARERIVEDGDATPPPGWFSPVEAERYDRQFNFFGEFAGGAADKYSYQKSLKEKKVAVVGLGGAGSWVIYGLALAGVGRLLLVDHGRVGWSNLNRHALYEERDVGRHKAEAISRRVGAVNSGVGVEVSTKKIASSGDLEPLLGGCDLVINMSDEPDANMTHEWVGEACVRLSLPHILGGGYNCKIGSLGFTVIPFQTACWVCIRNNYFKEDPSVRSRTPHESDGIDRLVGGSLGAILGVVGNFHALEALRVLTGFAPPQWCDKARHFNFLTDEVLHKEVSRDPQCALCGSAASAAPSPGRSLLTSAGIP